VVNVAVAGADTGFLYGDLQVDAEVAIGADDDVGANAIKAWHVAARVRNAAVGGVVKDELVKLAAGGSRKPLSE